MRLPVKPNGAGWPAPFSRLAPSSEDPRLLAYDTLLPPHRFSEAVSALRFGSTFKTTRPRRHLHSNRYVKETYSGTRPVILDIGASDGSTSVDLIDALGDSFSRYYVTDLHLTVSCGFDDRGVTYFKDRDGRCVLSASSRWLAYDDPSGGWLPLRLVAKRMLARSARATDWREVQLIQPSLIRHTKSDSRIQLVQYDMFTPWVHQSPDLIKVANVLNPEYFSSSQARRALEMQCAHLAPGGRLLVVHGPTTNGQSERFSVLRKTASGMTLEHEHDGGVDVAALVQSPTPSTTSNHNGSNGVVLDKS
jgi:hypothetical protein